MSLQPLRERRQHCVARRAGVASAAVRDLYAVSGLLQPLQLGEVLDWSVARHRADGAAFCPVGVEPAAQRHWDLHGENLAGPGVHPGLAAGPRHGARYEGEWEYNQANGKGKFLHTDGDIYDGAWKNNRQYGFGIYTNSKGARYEGQWVNDQQHGEGVENWTEGARYEGDYQGGLKSGTGKYTYNDGSTYDGEWSNNRINGYGTQIWSDGKEYYG